jgi:mannose-6-phosphate isomerase-like protein (cupin superfamily)
MVDLAGSGTIERITAKGINVWMERPRKLEKLNISSKVELISYADKTPANMQRPDGETLKLLVGDGISIELSKRRSPMPFWHRNMEYDEVIVCVKGEGKWMTDMGDFLLKAGEMLFIPKGVSHSASADQKSEYMAVEIKSRNPLTYSKPPE